MRAEQPCLQTYDIVFKPYQDLAVNGLTLSPKMQPNELINGVLHAANLNLVDNQIIPFSQ